MSLGVSIPLLVVGMVILYFSMRKIAHIAKGYPLVPSEVISSVEGTAAVGEVTENSEL